MEIVSAVQQALAGKVGSELVRIWASSSFVWQLEGQRLTLLAPDSFRLDRLRKFRTELHAAALAVIGPQAVLDLKAAEAPAAEKSSPRSIQRELPGLGETSPTSA